jgi:oligoribonuclease NrnB/cAMP/cGMP phosphodiesterase (DHH superfamily)
MKPLVIYHGNCVDGFGAAWVFHKFAPFECEFHHGVYSKAPPDVTDREVYLVDFSYRRNVVEQMLEKAKRITLIDHHKSAVDDLLPLIDKGAIVPHISMEHSGAMLAWQWHRGFNDKPPQLINHIEDRDLWRFALPGTREIQSNLFSYPYDFKVWDELMERPVEDMIADGKAIERKHHKDVGELLGLCTRRMNIGGYNVPVANMPYTLASDAGHLLAKGEPFAACYWDTPEGRVFGLRSSKDGVDVSEVAFKYGGGGHATASGFKISYEKAAEFEVSHA